MTGRKLLVPGAEELDDIGLLFGGLEDQSLHHDTARQLTSWMVCDLRCCTIVLGSRIF
jgi:hypothetical protein